MRKRDLLGIYLIILAVVALVSAGCCPLIPTGGTTDATKPRVETQPAPAGEFAAGDSVAAVWEDGSYYLATVTRSEGDQVTVRWTDSATEDTVAAADVRPVEVREWSVGDRVLAVWASGRFYEGTITAADDPSYTVAWDDGSTPSAVTSDKIIAAE